MKWTAKRLHRLASAVSLAAALSSPFSAAGFSVPERLVYDISWSGIKAGTAVQEAVAANGDLRIVSTARSAGWLSPIFPVRDQVESVVSPGGSGDRPWIAKWYRERINEGRTHRDKEARFNVAGRSVGVDDALGKAHHEDAISARTLDSLSCLYFVRSSALMPGSSLYLDIYDCKKLWNTEVQVVRREQLVTARGTFQTIVVKPLLRSEGVFARTGAMTIWLTDDERRIPVKMTTKVKIGAITATLVGGSYWP